MAIFMMNCIKLNRIKPERIVLVVSVFSFVVFLLFSAPAYSSNNSKLLGAENVIAKMKKEIEEVHQNFTEKAVVNPTESLEQELKLFKEKKHLDPELAAEEWLNLLDRFWNLPQSERISGDRYSSYYGDFLSLLTFIKAVLKILKKY